MKGLEVKLERGAIGQFDILVDGELVASRGGGFFQRLLGGGWPDPEEILEKIRSRQPAPA